MMYRESTTHHNNQGAFATDKIDEKLEEGVYSESLSDLQLSDRLKNYAVFERGLILRTS